MKNRIPFCFTNTIYSNDIRNFLNNLPLLQDITDSDDYKHYPVFLNESVRISFLLNEFTSVANKIFADKYSKKPKRLEIIPAFYKEIEIPIDAKESTLKVAREPLSPKPKDLIKSQTFGTDLSHEKMQELLELNWFEDNLEQTNPAIRKNYSQQKSNILVEINKAPVESHILICQGLKERFQNEASALFNGPRLNKEEIGKLIERIRKHIK